MAYKTSMFDWSNGAVGDRLADLQLSAKDMETRLVDPALIDEHPANRAVHEDKVDELVESIRQDGLAQYPLVRVSPADPTRYEHIAGWHRILAWRLLGREDPAKYAKMTVVVKKRCTDEEALRLMHATNLVNAELSLEERGRAYEVLAYDVAKAREEDPDAFKGRRTNDVVAEMASRSGRSVSPSAVARARRAANGGKPPAQPAQGDPDPLAGRRERLVSRMSAVADEAEELAGLGGEVPVDALKHYWKRIKEAAAEGARR